MNAVPACRCGDDDLPRVAGVPRDGHAAVARQGEVRRSRRRHVVHGPEARRAWRPAPRGPQRRQRSATAGAGREAGQQHEQRKRADCRTGTDAQPRASWRRRLGRAAGGGAAGGRRRRGRRGGRWPPAVGLGLGLSALRASATTAAAPGKPSCAAGTASARRSALRHSPVARGLLGLGEPVAEPLPRLGLGGELGGRGRGRVEHEQRGRAAAGAWPTRARAAPRGAAAVRSSARAAAAARPRRRASTARRSPAGTDSRAASTSGALRRSKRAGGLAERRVRPPARAPWPPRSPAASAVSSRRAWSASAGASRYGTPEELGLRELRRACA